MNGPIYIYIVGAGVSALGLVVIIFLIRRKKQQDRERIGMEKALQSLHLGEFDQGFRSLGGSTPRGDHYLRSDAPRASRSEVRG